MSTMASRYVCTACRRVFQQQSRKRPQVQSLPERLSTFHGYRRFSTIHRHAASVPPEPAPYQSKNASNTGKNPLSGAAPPPPSKIKPKAGSTTQSLAKSLRENLPAATETYVAYGVCGKLVQECARQAEYRIPQATEKGVEVPKTKDGVDLGVGEGWWYESTLPLSFSHPTPSPYYRNLNFLPNV